MAVATVEPGHIAEYLEILEQRIMPFLEEQGAEVAAELTMISVSGFQFFLGNIGVMLSGFDAIWVLLAVGTAWGIPKLNSEH